MPTPKPNEYVSLIWTYNGEEIFDANDRFIASRSFDMSDEEMHRICNDHNALRRIGHPAKLEAFLEDIGYQIENFRADFPLAMVDAWDALAYTPQEAASEQE